MPMRLYTCNVLPIAPVTHTTLLWKAMFICCVSTSMSSIRDEASAGNAGMMLSNRHIMRSLYIMSLQSY